ncbi:hypothetical protein BASA81_000373 [Batrachochytrium salamandrivorans]|nr:hypothetical protein BASA81_000373 [Batrachochytrium salamandrivorans]
MTPFELAQQRLVDIVRAGGKVDVEVGRRLYALYKQATFGDCEEDDTFWFAERGLSQQQAMIEYTALVDKLSLEPATDFSPNKYFETLITWLLASCSIPQRQAICVFALFTMFPLTLLAYPLAFALLCFPITCGPMLIYLTWMLFGDTAAISGGRRNLWLQSSLLGKYFCDYFPITLECSNDNSKVDSFHHHPYVFVYHPHGVIGLGSFGAFATTGCEFTKLFPGIAVRLLTLDQNFYLPFVREVLLWFGMCSCSLGACNNLLQRGWSICLLVGGARESLEAQPGEEYRLILNKRRGFVKVAIENNAQLVPVVGFGEIDAFDLIQLPNSWWTQHLFQLQVWCCDWLGFTLPAVWPIPKRGRIRVVVGPPLPSPRSLQQHSGLVGDELVDLLHQEFTKAIEQLFNREKSKPEEVIVIL